MNLGPAPNQFRYFLATPFSLLGDILCYIGVFIMGEANAKWRMLSDMQEMGMVEILSPEEYEAKYGKKPDEQEDNNR